jgi:uncharacterized repeat protein (TIGR03806 family)
MLAGVFQRTGLLAALVLGRGACSGPAMEAPSPHFIAEGNPALLSDWGMMQSNGHSLTLAEGVAPYDLVTPLFSDYAHKQRTIWMPAGETAIYREDNVLDFPVGTVITKTFYYPRGAGENEILQTLERAPGWRADGLDLAEIRLVETRVLVHREAGWTALPYVWNAEQTEASLARAGAIERLTLVDDAGERQDFAYAVPNANQCAGCHAINNTTRAIQPIGPAPRHLNRSYDYASGPDNQLAHLVAAGYLDTWPGADLTPQDTDYLDASAGLDDRARSYLDINCAHCHNAVGPADTSGLHLRYDTPDGPNLGLCKPPVAAGGGTGNRPYDIMPGDPDLSILLYRISITDPGSMMPELGRSVDHREGLALIREWIESMPASCVDD